jgi:putative addiction module component (TIGR02574 family)
MSSVPAELLDAALKLPKEARSELADRLLDSLGPVFDDAEIEAEWAAEIKRRVDDLKSGREKGIPWEEARQMMFGDGDEPDAG